MLSEIQKKSLKIPLYLHFWIFLKYLKHEGLLNKNQAKHSWAKRWCSLVQAKLWLETTTRQQDKTKNSMKIMGPLASTKEHQN